jgi:hypothetical protein
MPLIATITLGVRRCQADATPTLCLLILCFQLPIVGGSSNLKAALPAIQECSAVRDTMAGI